MGIFTDEAHVQLNSVDKSNRILFWSNQFRFSTIYIDISYPQEVLGFGGNSGLLKTVHHQEQGVPEKMFLSEKGTLLAKEHFSGTPGMFSHSN